MENCESPKKPTVEIITYNNSPRQFPIEKQAEKLGLRLHVVARTFRPWSWVAKITEPKRFLETLTDSSQRVMLVDGNDTIFTRPPYVAEIDEILKHYNSPVALFCPTPSNWPPNEDCRIFERGLSRSPKPHLSAGAYVGTVAGILEGMEWIEEQRRKGGLKFGGRFDDQLAWRRVHRTLHPKYAIDTEGLLFERFDRMYLMSNPEECKTWKLTIPAIGSPAKTAPLKRQWKRRVFIDCGANNCAVLRKQIKKYAGFEFHAFEPLPELSGEGLKVIDENPNVKIRFYNKAVWINDQTMDFYKATRWGKNYRGGSTLIRGQMRNASTIDYSCSVKVEAIDFSKWLKANVDQDDYVVVKMDIEGAEYAVLEKVISDNNQHLIKELIIEFHQPMNSMITRKRHDELVAKIRKFARLVRWP